MMPYLAHKDSRNMFIACERKVNQYNNRMIKKFLKIFLTELTKICKAHFLGTAYNRTQNLNIPNMVSGSLFFKQFS